MIINERTVLEDDSTEPVSLLVKHRIPWLLIGLLGGIAATIVASQYEQLLNSNIALAFFIPVIVYMSDAVGTQTETIYVRNLAKKQIRFATYLFKEFLLGLSLGTLFAFLIGLFAYFWFKSFDVALTVGLSMLITMTTAPAIALIVSTVLTKEHKDPAIGAGPFTTVIQDLISLLIYFAIASMVIFR